MLTHFDIILPAYPRGFHLIDEQVFGQLELPETGLLHIFIHHTSAGLCINENADPTVRLDFETIFNKLVPEGLPEYLHNLEGDDDMPAHVKSVLSGASVSLPVRNGRPVLGTWQGIYLCEFRNNGGRRKLTVSVVE